MCSTQFSRSLLLPPPCTAETNLTIFTGQVWQFFTNKPDFNSSSLSSEVHRVGFMKPPQPLKRLFAQWSHFHERPKNGHSTILRTVFLTAAKPQRGVTFHIIPHPLSIARNEIGTWLAPPYPWKSTLSISSLATSLSWTVEKWIPPTNILVNGWQARATFQTRATNVAQYRK